MGGKKGVCAGGTDKESMYTAPWGRAARSCNNTCNRCMGMGRRRAHTGALIHEQLPVEEVDCSLEPFVAASACTSVAPEAMPRDGVPGGAREEVEGHVMGPDKGRWAAGNAPDPDQAPDTCPCRTLRCYSCGATHMPRSSSREQVLSLLRRTNMGIDQMLSTTCTKRDTSSRKAMNKLFVMIKSTLPLDMSR